MLRLCLIVLVCLIFIPLVGYHVYAQHHEKKEAHIALNEIYEYINSYRSELTKFESLYLLCIYDNDEFLSAGGQGAFHFPSLRNSNTIKKMQSYASRYSTGTIREEVLKIDNLINYLERAKSETFDRKILTDYSSCYSEHLVTAAFLVQNGEVVRLDSDEVSKQRSKNIFWEMHFAIDRLSTLYENINTFHDTHFMNFQVETSRQMVNMDMRS